MMGRILGNHSEIFTCKELHFFGTIWTNTANQDLNRNKQIELLSRLLCVQEDGLFNQQNTSVFNHKAIALLARDDVPDEVVAAMGGDRPKYAKDKKALSAKAGFKKFFPVPPKISLATTIPKLIPTATCHNGASGGQQSAKRTVVTKAPSLISCPLTIAKTTSHNIPTINVTK